MRSRRRDRRRSRRRSTASSRLGVGSCREGNRRDRPCPDRGSAHAIAPTEYPSRKASRRSPVTACLSDNRCLFPRATMRRRRKRRRAHNVSSDATLATMCPHSADQSVDGNLICGHHPWRMPTQRNARPARPTCGDHASAIDPFQSVFCVTMCRHLPALRITLSACVTLKNTFGRRFSGYHSKRVRGIAAKRCCHAYPNLFHHRAVLARAVWHAAADRKSRVASRVAG